MGEIWKDIVGYEGCYQISTFGNIRCIRLQDSTGRRRRQQPFRVQGKGKYANVRLCKNGMAATFMVHRLVLEAFSSQPSCCPTGSTKFEINHKALNSSNNRLDNLEYTTRQENVDHAKVKTQLGCTRILTEEKVLEIHELYTKRIPQSKIAQQYGVSRSTISDIVHGRLWKHIPTPRRIIYRKLTAESVSQLKTDLQCGILSQRDIAKKFNVTPSLVQDIKKGRVWAHVTISEKN